LSYPVQGLILVHAANPAIFRQIGWTISRVLGYEVLLDWTAQPAKANSGRTELIWSGSQHHGAHLTSALAGWTDIVFEVTQDAFEGQTGSRWMYTPELGIRHRSIDELGNVVIGEVEMRSALERAGSNALELHREMQNLLATPWDSELEPLRAAGADARIVWLYRAS